MSAASGTVRPNSQVDIHDVGRMFRSSVQAAGSMAAWAERNRVSYPTVRQVHCGHMQPTAAILDALGLRMRTVFEFVS